MADHIPEGVGMVNPGVTVSMLGLLIFFPQCLLFHERRQTDKGTELFVVGRCRAFPPATSSDPKTGTAVLRRNLFVSRMVIVNCQTDLLEVVAATHAASRFTCRLNSGQQQTNKHTDDGDDD
jgi:hypothetical protein